MHSTRTRVPAHTDDAINDQIQERIDRSVRYYDKHRDKIPQRLLALDQEWDIERAIEANASSLALFGVLMAAGGNRRWLLLPGMVTGFLLQHAIQGWCPPIPILRRLGFRTSHEIEQERQALKAVRGDYQSVTEATDRAEAAIRAVRG